MTDARKLSPTFYTLIRALLQSLLSNLRERGHDPRVVHGWTATFGGAHMIRVEPSGTFTAAADPRREAYGMAY